MRSLNPLDSKDALRWLLTKLKEDGELDHLVEWYVYSCLKHKVLHRPSKGPYGEQGKDIVALENEFTGEYCSYIIKRGNLDRNLYHPKYGILKQLEDALLVDLDIAHYKGKRRTAVVVHNGSEGNRSAVRKYEDHCCELYERLGDAMLVRPVARWDIEEITTRLWNCRDELRRYNEIALHYQRLASAEEIIINIKANLEQASMSGEPITEREKSILDKILHAEYKYGRFVGDK